MNPPPCITLDELMADYEEGVNAKCWYVPGKHLNQDLPNPEWITNYRTFVQAHKVGDFTVGYLGLYDGTLTFFRLKTLPSLDHVRRRYPHLFKMSGLSYPMQRGKSAC